MARILLDLSQDDLAQKIGVARKTIMRIENGQSPGSAKIIDKIKDYLENNKICFLKDDGVTRNTEKVWALKGKSGFDSFYEDLYKTVSGDRRSVCICNSDERSHEKWFGKNIKTHTQRIIELGARYKILICEDDTHFFTPEYAEYRWMPKNNFTGVPFIVYGDKLAIVTFKEQENQTTIVLDYPEIADAYRTQFELFWKSAKIPNSKHGKKS